MRNDELSDSLGQVLASILSMALDLLAVVMNLPFMLPLVVFYVTFRIIRRIWNRQHSGIGYIGSSLGVSRAVTKHETATGFTRTAEMVLEQACAAAETPGATETATPEPVEWKPYAVPKAKPAPTWDTYLDSTPGANPDPEPVEPWEGK